MSRPETLPQISVIIPVYNDLARLRRCIQALRGQTLPANYFEILIIDNLSSDDLRVESGVKHGRPLLKVLEEEKPGSYAARNRGVLSARGQLIAFTDSDCIPAATWLEHGIEALKSLSTDHLIGGAIVMSFEDPCRPGIFELYDQAVHLRQRDYVLHHGFAATANLMVPRVAFDKVGLFREDLKSKGDMEWCERARLAGFRLVYVEAAVVNHPCRRTLASLIKKNRRTVGGICDRFSSEGWSEIFRREFYELRRKHASIAKSFDNRQWRLKNVMYCVLWLFEVIRIVEMVRVSLGNRTVRE